MNKYALIPFLLILFFNAKAQDKIISNNHDTIHCAIVSINKDRILYEQKNSNGSVTGKFISLSQVAEYSWSHQPKPPHPAYSPEKPWCLGLKVGRSTMPWYFDEYESSSVMRDYYNKQKTGSQINASAHYMIESFLGLGVEYSFFKTSTSSSLQVEYSPLMFLTESEKYRQYIHYLGVSVLFQQPLDAQRKFIISESFSAGVLFLRLEEQSTSPNFNQSIYNDISDNMLLTGNTFCGKVGLTAEYKLFDALSVGLGGDFLWCTLKKASVEAKGPNVNRFSGDNQELANAIKLSRIDYSIVLRYHF